MVERKGRRSSDSGTELKVSTTNLSEDRLRVRKGVCKSKTHSSIGHIHTKGGNLARSLKFDDNLDLCFERSVMLEKAKGIWAENI